MTPLTPNMLAVQIPEDAIDFELHDDKFDKPHLTYKVGMGTDDFDILRETLPPGSWSILGTAKDGVPEFECGLYADKVIIRHEVPVRHAGFLDREMFRNYQAENQYDNAFEYAKESFSSLLHSCGCGVGRWLVLNKEK